MVTKAYLETELLPTLERVLKEVGPDSLHDAMRVAYPEASLRLVSDIEIFAQFGGGSISPLVVEYSHLRSPLIVDYSHLSEVPTRLDPERGAIVIGEDYAYFKSFGLVLNEVVDVVGEYLLICCVNETGGNVAGRAKASLAEILKAYSGTLRESGSDIRYQGAVAAKQQAPLASSNNSRIVEHRSSTKSYSRVDDSSHRPSISGWLAYLLGLYLVGSGTFNIIQLVRGGSDAYKAGAETLRQYGIDSGLTPATIVASYVVGAPIFVGSGLMVLGSIARDMKRSRQNSSG